MKISTIIIIILTLATMIVYSTSEFYHAHIITGYCPMGGPHVVTCTPPGATLDGHVTGRNYRSYTPFDPRLVYLDGSYDDTCQGYVAGGSQVCSEHEGN